jgi:hypothetical protein
MEPWALHMYPRMAGSRPVALQSLADLPLFDPSWLALLCLWKTVLWLRSSASLQIAKVPLISSKVFNGSISPRGCMGTLRGHSFDG